MRSELRPLARAFHLRRSAPARWQGALGRAELVATVIGVGPAMAAGGVARLLDVAMVDHVVMAGVCGAVAPGLTIGAVMVPERVIDETTGAAFVPYAPPGTVPRGTLLTTATFGSGPRRQEELASRQVDAVDMETAVVGRICQERGIGWSVLRAVSDRVADGLVDDLVFGLVRPDGGTNGPAVLRLLATRPGQLRPLARVAQDTNRAMTGLVGAVRNACAALAS